MWSDNHPQGSGEIPAPILVHWNGVKMVKKPIKVKFFKTPFGASYEIIGGSKKSRKIAEDICFAVILTTGIFSLHEDYQLKAAEKTINNVLAERGYSTEV